MMDLDAARATAYQHRKDLLSLQQQIVLNAHILRAVKYQRLPTLAFNGFYGVIGLTGGSYHGYFSAAGSLKFPIFKEAAQRGQQQQAEAQLSALRQQESSLRATIDAQIRGAMLDVASTEELARVAQSNVALAQQEFSDESDRFKAGVDDNLPWSTRKPRSPAPRPSSSSRSINTTWPNSRWRATPASSKPATRSYLGQ